jgi:hypothetical protein
LLSLDGFSPFSTPCFGTTNHGSPLDFEHSR